MALKKYPLGFSKDYSGYKINKHGRLARRPSKIY